MRHFSFVWAEVVQLNGSQNDKRRDMGWGEDEEEEGRGKMSHCEGSFPGASVLEGQISLESHPNVIQNLSEAPLNLSEPLQKL